MTGDWLGLAGRAATGELVRIASYKIATMPGVNDRRMDDYRWLVSDEAAPWLAMAESSGAGPLATATRLRRDLSSGRAHLVLEQVELRSRAGAKFAHAGQMFFTPVGLQQATDEIVARYKAGRFPAEAPLADLCCGIGGDLLSLARRGPVTGIDRDGAAAIVAAANLQRCGCSGTVQRGDVADTSLGEYAAWHIDPDRRPAGRRTTRVELHQPDAATVERLLQRLPTAAIKLAPAATFPAAWEAEAELEWISRGGQCRQLVAWFGGLARRPGLRAATVMIGDADVPRTVVGIKDSSLRMAKIGRFVLEPDAAVLAAGLSAALASEHHLASVAPGIAYLTGDRAIADPALACFEVIEVLPLDVRRLMAVLRARRIGRLEVKKRGVSTDPDTLRRKLGVHGDQSATLMVAPIDGSVTAILARRLRQVPSAGRDLGGRNECVR